MGTQLKWRLILGRRIPLSLRMNGIVWSSGVQLRTYTGEKVAVRGVYNAEVKVKNERHRLPLLVVAGSGPSLVGRNWLHSIRLDWPSIFQLKVNLNPSILDSFKEVFGKDLGTIKVSRVNLQLKPGAIPKYHRPRPVPYALREKVKAEILKLEADGILKRVDHSDWGAPIVVVPKANGSIRICGDYKVTVNPYLIVDQYPLPLPEDIFATLEGGALFTKLDLSQAYLQLELDDASRKLCTINTFIGLFEYTRMPFGIASAPSIFQRVMDDMFRDLPWVKCYLDDILITGRNVEEHWQRVLEVLSRLQRAGVRLQREKCLFAVPELPYLGFVVSSEGLKTSPSKVKAILDTKRPHDLTSLRAYLGLVNYYGKFIPRLSAVAAPLNKLLRKE